jgi:hypothetical protein
MALTASSPSDATPLLNSSSVNNHAINIHHHQNGDVGDGGDGAQNANSATPSDGLSSSRSEASWWAAYVDAVESHPLLTKSITAAVILGAADLTAQFVEYLRGESTLEGNVAPDWPRTLRFAVMGLIGAPWSHYYFYWLDRYYPPTAEPWTKVTALKVCVDQFIQAPLLLAFMIAALSLMKGLGLIGVKHDLQHTFLDALIANCKGDKLPCICFGRFYAHDEFLVAFHRETLDSGVHPQPRICTTFPTCFICQRCLFLLDNHIKHSFESGSLSCRGLLRW